MKPTNPTQMARSTDSETSKQASIGASKRSPSQKIQLLIAYAMHPNGLTDDEAGTVSGLSSLAKCCYWKRCSDLENEGFIARTLETRPSLVGNQMMVRAITPKGLAEARRWMR